MAFYIYTTRAYAHVFANVGSFPNSGQVTNFTELFYSIWYLLIYCMYKSKFIHSLVTHKTDGAI